MIGSGVQIGLNTKIDPYLGFGGVNAAPERGLILKNGF